MALVKRLVGLEELVIPDEESRTKQYREIAQLVAESPIVKVTPSEGSPTNSVGARHAVPATDASAIDLSPTETILPSIVPDEFADNHTVELEICMRWFSSDAGQVAKIEAPLGYANVRAHALFHRDYLLKQQAHAQQPAAPQPRACPRR